MKVRNMYAYDPETGEYKGLVPTTIDPRASEQAGHDVWMIPANATSFGPNLETLKEHEVCVFDNERNKWITVPDYRGTEVYNALTKEFTQWREIGEIPEYCYPVDNLPYSRNIMVLLDWTKDKGLVIKSYRDTVLETIKDHRKLQRNIILQDNIVIDNNTFKTTSEAFEDYQRIIVLDMVVETWVDATGKQVQMTPTLAKTLLKMIQNRKDEQINRTAALIEKDKTASSNQLIKQLESIFK